MTSLRRPPLFVLFVLGAIACSGAPWKVANAPTSPPDEQFQTGVEVGEEVYVWHCYQGSRVLVRQSSSACFGAGPTELYKGACGTVLPEETPYAARRDAGGPGWMPESLRWPGSEGATTSR
jgi:hypothetical protein